MTDSSKYIKIVEWSEEDLCFVGCCPGIIGRCCHGDDEVEVYREVCRITDEWLAIMRRRKETLPPPTIGRDIAGMLMSEKQAL